MLAWLRKKLQRVMAWFRPEVQVPFPLTAPPKHNRTMRRRLSALERARRKHDKLVIPQGAPPTPRSPHAEHEKKPKAAVADQPEIPSAELLIADRHHTGGDENVLYKESEFWGEFNFRDTILDQLDRYFVYLKRMRGGDRDAYEFYKKLGATIIPYSAMGISADWDRAQKKLHGKIPELPSYFNKHRPSFGCFVFAANPFHEEKELVKTADDKRKKLSLWIPKFAYFTKYNLPPPEYQPMSGGDVYRMTVYWDRPQDSRYKHKHGVPQSYGVFISADGRTVQILRALETKWIETLRKNKKKDARGNLNFYTSIPQRAWCIPDDFEQWAKYHGVDAQTHLGTIFVDCVKTFETSNYSTVRVAVIKDDMTAIFGVDVRRMSYFFKDRDYVLNEHGGRKSIFHMVRTHERRTKNGVTSVKFHFRGERQFKWAGYDVSVTVPGRDHFMMPDMTVPSTDSYWVTPKEWKEKNMLKSSKLADKLVEWMRDGVGGTRH